MVKDQQPQAAKEAAGNVLPGWLDAFNVLLDLDPQQDVSGEHWDGLEIRVQIFKVRTLSVLFYARFLDLVGKNRLSTRYTRLSTRHRTVFAGLCYRLSASPPRALSHIRAILSCRQHGVPNSSEGEPIELYKLAAPLVDFVTGATRQSKARVSFDEGTLTQLVDALVQWGQMTKENVRASGASHE
jgi:hypothetical protein